MDDQTPKVRVVGIGASAGAMDPLKEFFHEIGAETGLAFAVVQHLDPTHVSYMAEVLTRHTAMKVNQAKDRSPIEANHVYTIPPNKFLFVKDGMLHLSEPVKRDGLRLPIDFFFRSLAQDQDGLAIAVLFSGGGSDGTLGIRDIHGAGGLVIVQNPETAQFDSMLQSAIATGVVDYVLPVREIPGRLLQYVQQTSVSNGSDIQTIDDSINSILNLLVSQTKADFRCYKRTTVQRRIERRMGLNQISDIADYDRFVAENPAELEKLAKDMLINVTSFFRDPEAFADLREKVIVPLVQENHDSNPIRGWIAGCATGEEAYSIAMLFIEEMARAKRNSKLQVFATDISREALKTAREGIYPQSIAADLSEERLARFFTKKDGTYQIDQQVRECVTFAEHNVVLDPPFLRMDLISCRNLMIYIEPEVQKKIVNLFAFALRTGRYLFLGKSDTTNEESSMFEPISRNWRIFRRQSSVAVPFQSFPTRPGFRSLRFEEQQPAKLAELNQQALLQHFNAGMVLISDNGTILHFYGPTRKYLAHPHGDANLNLYEMVENKHSVALRLAVERAARENQSVKLTMHDFGGENGNAGAEVTITPVVEPKTGKRLLAVIFEPAGAALKTQEIVAKEPHEEDARIVAQLEADNRRLKQDLQSAFEAFQVTHEEFTAANEEVLATNEELQSANEELETSKEELQSVNEELITVNSQLRDKIEELTTANDDLANFLNTSEIGVLFLDKAFCIRRFTSSVTRLMNLIALDVGRPVGDISSTLTGVDFVSLGNAVLKNLASYEKEVAAADGSWHMLRCIPYRTLSGMIDGVVFTFTDVTRLKQSEEAMLEARNYAENIIHTIGSSLLVLDAELKVVSANRAFYQIFHVRPEETEHRLIYELGSGHWNIPKLRELLDDILSRDSQIENFEVENDFPGIGQKIMSLNARKIIGGEDGDIRMILLAIDDITGRRQAEAERVWLEGELRQAQKMESIGTLAAGIAHDFNNNLNIIQGYASVLKELGAKDEIIGESVAAILEGTKRSAAIVQQLLTLAHKTEPKFELLNIESLVHELAQLLRQTFPKTVDIKVELSRDTPPVMADRGQMTQVFLNICVNARDAMPNGGSLTIKTAVVNRTALPNVPDLTAEKYVSIDFRDTGVGIDERIINRIFEPFFTTKATGRGTGLGLAVGYGIVRHHKGFIQVSSKPMEGASFRVYLPAVLAGG